MTFLGTAKQLFENLTKRFCKRRISAMKASKSGSGKKDVEESENDLREYQFLTWLCPFIRSRKSKSNFPDEEDQKEPIEQSTIRQYDDDDDGDDDIGNDNNDDHPLENGDNSKNDEPICEMNEKRKDDETPNRTKKRRGNDIAITNEKGKHELMSSISKYMASRMEKPPPAPKTEDEVFGNMIAMQMAKLTGIFKVQAQHEINNTVFRFIMAQENSRTTPKSFPSPIPYNLPTQPSPSCSSSLSSPVSAPEVGKNVGSWLSLMNQNLN